MNLPPELAKISHDNESTHAYLEIKIDGDWKILDATWDDKLKTIFHVNEWYGKSNTKIAVKPTRIFTPQKSLEIINDQDEEVTNKDLEINGKFYKGFNEWLNKNRK